MKSLIMSLLLVFFGAGLQSSEVSFKVEVSTDTVLLGNYFEVKFTIENAQPNFSPPEFTDFDIVGGPNQASSFSMINGQVSRSASFTYFLKPREEGVYYIDAAAIEVDGKLIETPPVEIFVLPNPDGIIENPHQLRQIEPERDRREREKEPTEPRRTIRL